MSRRSTPSATEILKAVFVRPVKLRRVGSSFHVVLADNEPAEAVPAERPMHAELKALFDAAPASRKVLRTLATIEHQLGKRDASFIHDLSLPVLRQARRQLDGLAPQPGPGIAQLRAHIVDAIALRERLQRERDLLRPSTLIGEKLQMREGSLSDFQSDFRTAFGAPP